MKIKLNRMMMPSVQLFSEYTYLMCRVFAHIYLLISVFFFFFVVLDFHS